MGDEWVDLSIKAGTVFTPSAPIDVQQLFAGRYEQLTQVMDVVSQKGQHAIIFGERGVGKTSLANIITAVAKLGGAASGSNVLSLRVNSDSVDTYSSLWHKIFSEITLSQQVKGTGFTSNASTKVVSLADEISGEVSTGTVRQVLAKLSVNSIPIIIIDEFDRISKAAVRAAMADTIKTLSDHAVAATIILVAVADSVDHLIKEHQSIERALVQIKMPRMSDKELKIIISNGLKELGMTIDDDAENQIILLSQGLPHYTHLLGLFSVRQAIESSVKNITIDHVELAITKAIKQAQQTTLSAYSKAISSPRKDNIFAQVLLASALAKTDGMGYFAAADVRKPLSIIMRKKYEIPSFSRHLNEFSEHTRGPILNKIGKKHSFRFRFVNPLYQPFITMKGYESKLIDRKIMEELR